MPLIRSNTAGAEIFASARVARRFTFGVAAGNISTAANANLVVMNLPYCFWWVQMTAGPAGVTVTPTFAVSNNVAAGLIVPQWQAIIPALLLPAATPTSYGARVIANTISLAINVPGGGAGGTFIVILGGSL